MTKSEYKSPSVTRSDYKILGKRNTQSTSTRTYQDHIYRYSQTITVFVEKKKGRWGRTFAREEKPVTSRHIANNVINETCASPRCLNWSQPIHFSVFYAISLGIRAHQQRHLFISFSDWFRNLKPRTSEDKMGHHQPVSTGFHLTFCTLMRSTPRLGGSRILIMAGAFTCFQHEQPHWKHHELLRRHPGM